MNFPDKLRRKVDHWGVLAAGAVGIAMLAWMNTFGEVQAQSNPDDLCNSALECSDEGDLAHVQNLEGVPLNAALLWQAGLEPSAAEAIASTLGTLNIKGGGWYYSWDADHKYIMVGGQLIPAETFFGSLDAAAGYVAAPGQEVATTTARPEALPNPTVQQSTHEIENTASEELVVQETLNALEGLRKLLIVSVPVLTVLMALLIRRNKREEAIVRIEAAATSKRSKKNIASVSEDIRNRINGTPVATKPLDSTTKDDSHEIAATRAKPLLTMVFDGAPRRYEEKKKPKRLTLPHLTKYEAQLIDHHSYTFYERGDLDVEGSKLINSLPRRAVRSGERILGEIFVTVSDSCMYPWFEDDHTYLVAELIELKRNQLPIPGDIVIVEHRSTAVDLGIFVGKDSHGRINLLSICDTSGQPSGHKFIATLPIKHNDSLKFTVLASLDRNNKKSEELLVELLRQAYQIQEGHIDSR